MGKAQKYAIANLSMAFASGIWLAIFIVYLIWIGQEIDPAVRWNAPMSMIGGTLILIGILLGAWLGALAGKSADDASFYQKDFQSFVIVYVISLIGLIPLLALQQTALVGIALTLQLMMFTAFLIKGLRLLFVIKENNGCSCTLKSVGP
ncbi:MAG: hypothetical protein WCV73_01490 [Patescibacteria group bacterium]|jgi:hypothetical protein